MKIEFDLLANAADSIQRAIELVAWGDDQGEPRRLKQAVQAIAHGVELLLKERLKRVHPALLWENVDKYPNLAARTVTAEGAMGRLVNIGGLSFAEADIELIRSLRSTRNAIEHYSWTTTKHEADQIVGRGLAFALFFSKAELGFVFFGYHTRKDDTFASLLSANREFAAAFSARDSAAIAPDARIENLCSFCRAVSVNQNTGACRLCGHWNPYEADEDIPF